MSKFHSRWHREESMDSEIETGKSKRKVLEVVHVGDPEMLQSEEKS